MPRYKLTIAYDGTDFVGWQKQHPPASEHPDMPAVEIDGEQRAVLRSAQGVVEQAVRETLREPIELVGASRTDSGVHANGQVAAFTSHPDPERGVGWPAERGTETLVRAINSRLPRDILVRAAEVVAGDFNPIGGAVEKEYCYTIVSSPVRPLWDRRFVFHTWHELDPARMHAAAAHLVGTHDFAAFAQINHGRKTTVRTVFACSATLIEETPLDQFPTRRIEIRIRGNGFLYNMVRIVAGTLMEAGRSRDDDHKFAPNRLPGILESRDRTRAGSTLPPQGLRLEWVRYE